MTELFDPNGTYQCNRCLRFIPASGYCIRTYPSGSIGIKQPCKKCVAEYYREYRALNAVPKDEPPLRGKLRPLFKPRFTDWPLPQGIALDGLGREAIGE